MKQLDFTNYKFHCSGLKNLMVNPRLKSETLSETTKSYLSELFIKEAFGREKSDMVANKYVRKGIECETDSIELYEKVKGEKYFKNQETLANDYFVGTPDIIADDKVIDLKTSWDLWTFFNVDQSQGEKDYYYQLLGYMDLTGKKKASLAYCLVNTPEGIIADDTYRLQFYMPEEKALEYRNNYIFDDIPEINRVKSYEFEYKEEEVEKLKERVQLSREYLSSLSI